jgi:hypothetical protein
MFKTIVLAAYVSVSFAGAFLIFTIPAAADDDYDALMDSELASQNSASATSGAGAGKVTFKEF